MHQVTVKRKDLLKRIKKNRKEHRDLFLKAQEGYRIDMVEELDRMLKEAKAGKHIRRSVAMPEPQDHTADYDRVIDMLEMSVEDQITLDSNSFDNFVRDNWTWSMSARATNVMYASKLGK